MFGLAVLEKLVEGKEGRRYKAGLVVVDYLVRMEWI